MNVSPPGLLRIFVYGSLKRGYRNHLAYCLGYESFRPATVMGRLYRQADGYPMLVAPPSSILAPGGADWYHDLQRLAELDAARDFPASESPIAAESPVANNEWLEIRGEIYQWSASAGDQRLKVLARLDQLEDFYPAATADGGRASLYHRVVLLARHATGVEPAWTYIAPNGIVPPDATPMGCCWP